MKIRRVKNITATFDITELLPEDTKITLINRADQALYIAKANEKIVAKYLKTM